VGIGRWLRRLEFWWRGDQLADELQEELETHRLLRQEALKRAGDSGSDAVAGSRRALGGILLAREEARAVWIVSWIESLAVLQGVDHPSPWTFVSAGALLAAAVLIACYLPTRRAARGDVLPRL
jgi:hypothetical protein